MTIYKDCRQFPRVRTDEWVHIRDTKLGCLTNDPENQTKLVGRKCGLSEKFMWKFTWDPKHQGYIITHKKTGLVINTITSRPNVADLAKLEDRKGQRWVPLDRLDPYHTAFKLGDREKYYCLQFSQFSGSADNWAHCQANTYIRAVRPNFEIGREPPLDSGYNGKCGKGSDYLPPGYKPPAPKPINNPNTTPVPKIFNYKFIKNEKGCNQLVATSS